MHHKLAVRPMQPNDIPAVLAIQSHCYDSATRESGASFLAKLNASPTTCFMATLSGMPVGYLVSVPAEAGCPPQLNSLTYRVPPAPDCLYLHDLAIAPHAKGSGIAPLLVRAFFARLEQLDLRLACLTAVNASGAYWERYGFRVVPPSGALVERVATYGDGAQYMRLER